MKRLVLCGLLTSALVAPLVAQSPAGWKLRIDRSTNASDPDGAGDVQFTTIPNGFKAVNPAAAIYWHPNNTANGNYTLKGSFKLLQPSGHVNTYGLFIGGRVLEGTEQNYTYFLIGQDGSFIVRKRLGDRMPDPNAPPRGGGPGGPGGGQMAPAAPGQAPQAAPPPQGAQPPQGGQGPQMGQGGPGGPGGGGRGGGRGRGGPQAITEDVARGKHEAIRQPGADGTSTNDLEVRVLASTIDFAVNGTVVHSAPKAGINVDGIYGIRVNHLLNVEITNFSLTK